MAPPLDRAQRRYLAHSYPHNHDYRVVGRRLVPGWKLWRRDGRLRGLYPRAPESLVDLASCKGWFVLQAARAGCPRALGIDVYEHDVEVSRAVAAHLGAPAEFRRSRLDELATRVDAGDAPYRVALLVNAYPYLYFGSDRDERGTLDHDALFEAMRRVCDGQLVFSNRVDFARLPSHVRRRAEELGATEGYDPATIRAAAERRFRVEERRPLGRIPLWVLHARGR